jgi:kinesin family member 12
VKASFLEIYNE